MYLMKNVEQYAPQFFPVKNPHALGIQDHDRKSTGLVQR